MTETSNHIDPLLTTQDLSIGYHEGGKQNTLLSDLNLKLLPGRLVCFMGINGIGKSTLIRILSGIQKPLKGTVHYHQSGELSTKVAVVLTDRINASQLTVYELIAFGRYPYLDWRAKIKEEDVKIIDTCIEEINIRHLVKKQLYQLSDGQLQMAMIARALAQKADIILLDEPTAHLDLNNRVEIMNTLKRISHTMNKAMLVATHELDLALQVADDIWLVNDKDVLVGIPEDLILKGYFDQVFKFKGFDLKTGKVQQTAHRNISVKIIGEGYASRWTKKALERNGYSLSESADISILIDQTSSHLQWHLTRDQKIHVFNSIEDLLHSLP